MAHALKSICYRAAVVVKKFGLLKHRVRLAAGKGVAGQHQQRNAVGGGAATSGNHIGRARADGGHAGNNGLAIHLLGISHSSQRHILLILALIKFQVMAPLLQRLTHAHHAPVAKNAKDAADELAFYAVTFDILIVQELYQRLGHGQSNSLHILIVL